MTLSDHFRVGSVTKTFTATVILELVDRHALNLNDSISKWEPRVPNARRISIRMLLNMTSGIWDEGGAGSLLTKWIGQHCGQRPSPGCSRYWSPQSLVDLAIKQGPAYPPGIYNYSDTNYVLLAMIAQRVTHTPFGSLLRRLVFDPLHLRHTSFPTRTLAMPQPAAAGYLPVPTGAGNTIGGYEPGPLLSPSALFGAGNIISTLGDLQVWAKALGTGSLLKPTTQRLRLQVHSTPSLFQALAGTGLESGLMVSYGLGVADAGGLLGHNGIVAPPGYTSELWYLPRQRASVVVLLNSITPCTGSAELADATSASLAQLAFGPWLQRVGVPPTTCSGVTPN
jgi:D-alanyl-D-alanine carboxypeptidase